MIAIINQNRGFTLIEAIITGVMVAVVATSAALMYSGYINESRRQTVKNLAEAGAVAANAYSRRTGDTLQASDMEKLNLYYDASRFTVEIVPGSGANGIIRVTDDHAISDSAHY
jgi:Tfp pilus assembly protein PilE